MEVAVASVPSAVICTLQPVRLDLGVKHDARVINSLAAGAQKPQQEFVVLERAYPVLDTLELDGEDANDVEHASAERQVRTQQANRLLGGDRDGNVAIIHERQRPPVIARQPY